MIGGRPNQALYFIGYTADEALYLDPHRTQKSGSVGDKTEDSGKELDDTYHRQYASRLPFNQLDTSMAVVSQTISTNHAYQYTNANESLF